MTVGIEYFYQYDEDGNVVLAANGNPVYRKYQPYTLDKLKTRIIGAGKPDSVVEKHIALVAETLNFETLRNHLADVEAYESALNNYELAIEAYNALTAEEKVEREAPTQPTEPVLEFTPVTADDVTAMVVSELTNRSKIGGMEYDGHKVDLSEENQLGIASVLKGIELAEKYEQDIFPLNFKAATNGTYSTITFDNQNDYELFALQFIAARQTYFS